MSLVLNFSKRHLYFLASFAIIFLTACNINHPISSMSPDKIYKNWNLATIESIERQIDSCADKDDKTMYLNRLSGYKLLVENDNEQVRKASSRYTFLSKFLPENKDKGDFYIIETTDESGARVITWNFILRKIEKEKYQVEKYNENSGEWQKSSKTFQISLNMPENFSDYIVKSGNGINQDDIIISYVDLRGEVKSDFLLFNKLSKGSGLEKLFEVQ